jgi:hypothetical protein
MGTSRFVIVVSALNALLGFAISEQETENYRQKPFGHGPPLLLDTRISTQRRKVLRA